MTQHTENQETQNIINTYKVIYKAFFVFGNIMIAGILSIIIVAITSGQTINTQGKKQETREIQPLTIHNTNDDIIVYEYQNDNLNTKDDQLTSHGNIIQYQQYTLPIHIEKKPGNLPNIQTFEAENYNLGGLERAIKEIILQPTKKKIQITKTLPPLSSNITDKRKEKLQITDTENTIPIKEIYNLECITQKIKVTNHICNKHIESIIKSITSYNLANYHGEILDITKNTPQSLKPRICNNLIEYTRQTGDTSNTLSATVQKTCNPEKQKQYKKIRALSETNQDIRKHTKIRHLGFDQTINEYIAHSLMQKIYNDIKTGKIHAVSIEQYAHMREKILQNNYPISQFTYEAGYYIDNNIILYALNQKEYTQDMKKEKVQQIKTILKRMHQGNREIPGLKDKVKKKNTTRTKNTLLQETTEATETTKTKSTIQSNLYKESSQRQEGEKTISEGVIHMKNKGIVDITITLQNNTIESIRLPQSKKRENVINGLIQEGKIQTIDKIELIISENYTNIQANESINICDLIEETIKDSQIQCNNEKIIINKYINNQQIQYTIHINQNETITKIRGNNTHMLQRIQEEVKDKIKTAPTIEIVKIIDRTGRQKEKADDGVGASDKVLVVDRIKLYFGKEPENVGQRGSEFVIGIKLNGEKYFAAYDIQTHAIKNIILPNITIEGKRVSVPEFELPLNDTNIKNIQLFKKDPITYIKNTYPHTINLYNKAQNNQ